MRKSKIIFAAAVVFSLACFAIGYKYRGVAVQQLRKYERFQNQKHAYDFPAENNGWTKFGNTPVYGEGEKVMFDPYCYVEDSCLIMLLSDRSNHVLATVTSTDGIHWNDYQIVLSGVADTWEDRVNRGCIVKCDSIYYLWYTGQYQGKSNIGIAKSRDGVNFERLSFNPVLKPEFAHENLSVMNPCVIYDDECRCFKMWYSAGETYEPNVICYAESQDGILWDKREEPVLQKGKNKWEIERIGGCQVIKNGNYEIYYIGYQNIDVARICYAESVDGVHWLRSDNNLLLSPTNGSWDSDAVYKPSVVRWNGQLHLYYNGRKGHGEYIGLATKNYGEK